MTRFEEIYELADIIIESEEIRQAPLYKKYLFLYKFLQFSIAEFNTRCFRDLTTIEPFSYKTYNIVGDGLETEFAVSDSISSMSVYIERETAKNSMAFVPVFYSDYSINEMNGSVVFADAPKDGVRLNIYVYQTGYFYDDLDFEEKSILANGMVIAFYQNQLNRSTLLNQQVYGVGAKMYSQAEHLKQLNTILKDTKYEVEGRINAYTYENDPELSLNKINKQK